MYDDNGKPFIATLHNVLLAPDLCNRLFSIITLMNEGHTCFFHKGFCTVYFGSKEKNAATLPHSAQRKHAFWGNLEIKGYPLLLHISIHYCPESTNRGLENAKASTF